MKRQQRQNLSYLEACLDFSAMTQERLLPIWKMKGQQLHVQCLGVEDFSYAKAATSFN